MVLVDGSGGALGVHVVVGVGDVPGPAALEHAPLTDVGSAVAAGASVAVDVDVDAKDAKAWHGYHTMGASSWVYHVVDTKEERWMSNEEDHLLGYPVDPHMDPCDA